MDSFKRIEGRVSDCPLLFDPGLRGCSEEESPIVSCNPLLVHLNLQKILLGSAHPWERTTMQSRFNEAQIIGILNVQGS